MDMLDYENFVVFIQKTLPGYVGEQYAGWKVEERYTFKINEKLHTINLMPEDHSGEMVCPNIYLEKYYAAYEEGESLYAIMDEISEIVRNETKEKVMTEVVSEEHLMDAVIPVLINTEVNREYLKTIPHIPFLDLSIVFRAAFNFEEETHLGTMITNEMLEKWGTGMEELMAKANFNAARKYGVLLTEMKGIITATNSRYVYGAFNGLCNMDILRNIACSFHDDLYIAPSSIHEVFVVPCGEYCADSLIDAAEGAMEAGVLRKCDFLSRNIYRYDREKNAVSIVERRNLQ